MQALKGWRMRAHYTVICAYVRCTAAIHVSTHKYTPVTKNALYAHYGAIFHKPPSYTCRALPRV